MAEADGSDTYSRGLNMNWLQKSAQSGYLVPELAPKRYVRWEDREAELDAIRDEARKTAENLVSENGHLLAKWDAVNQSYCSRCNKQISIRDIYSTSGATFHGPATTGSCGQEHGAYDMPDYRIHGWKW